MIQSSLSILAGFCLATYVIAAPSTEIWDLKSGVADFSKFLSLLKETEMGFKLDSSRDLTIFLPTDRAVSAVGFDELENKLSYSERLRILEAHVVPMVIKIHDLPAGPQSFETLEGSTVTVSTVRRDPTRSQIRKGRGTMPRAFITLEGSKESYEITSGERPLETSIGVAYPISGLMVPQDLVDLLSDAKNAPSAAPGPVYEVPQHVLDTGRAHWRVGEEEEEEPSRKIEEEIKEELTVFHSQPLREAIKSPSIGVFPNQFSVDARGTSKKLEGGLVGFKPADISR